MTPQLQFEERLAAVEQAITELRAQIIPRQESPNWLSRFDGAFEDEPAFEEVIRYGREYRESGGGSEPMETQDNSP